MFAEITECFTTSPPFKNCLLYILKIDTHLHPLTTTPFLCFVIWPSDNIFGIIWCYLYIPSTSTKITMSPLLTFLHLVPALLPPQGYFWWSAPSADWYHQVLSDSWLHTACPQVSNRKPCISQRTSAQLVFSSKNTLAFCYKWQQCVKIKSPQLQISTVGLSTAFYSPYILYLSCCPVRSLTHFTLYLQASVPVSP